MTKVYKIRVQKLNSGRYVLMFLTLTTTNAILEKHNYWQSTYISPKIYCKDKTVYNILIIIIITLFIIFNYYIFYNPGKKTVDFRACNVS